jgi:hypothetical protein
MKRLVFLAAAAGMVAVLDGSVALAAQEVGSSVAAVQAHPGPGRGAFRFITPAPIAEQGRSPLFAASATAESSAASAAARAPTDGTAPTLVITTQNIGGSKSNPAEWSFTAVGSRASTPVTGVIIGSSPFEEPRTTRVQTYIVPIIFRTHTIATGFDASTDTLTATTAGDVTIDPTLPDSHCLSAPNNVPLQVTLQSPVFTPTHFVFGGTDLGVTQWVDAYQRASFYQALGAQANLYHVLLNPTVLPKLVIDVPADEGLAITDAGLVTSNHAGRSTSCVPMQFVNQTWFDDYVQATVLPVLAKRGVNPGTLPLFLTYNTFMGADNDTDLSGNNCCITGYHNVNAASPVQSYAAAELDRTGFFRGPDTGFDIDPLSHEIVEWVNNPVLTNNVVPYGTSPDCESLLEVADPLTGTLMQPILGANGFSYHPQEIAFFSYFLGMPSIGANGWFSSNNTLTSDVGPVCSSGS